MGAYIYGFSKREKVVPVQGSDDPMTLGAIKHLYKPYYPDGWDLHPAQQRLATQYETRNADRAFPEFVVIANDDGRVFQDGDAVFNIAERYNGNGTQLALRATFYDDPDGFGPVVGTLRKVRGKMVVVPSPQEES